VLYFFHGRNVAIVSHGFTKEDEVPSKEIDQATNRKVAFLASPTRHTYTGELP
jgi:hypothetical protein